MRWREGRRTFVPALLAVSVALACLGVASPAGAADTPTPDQLVAKAKKAAARPGQVLHTTGKTTSTGGQGSTVETWIDVANGRVRQQAVLTAPDLAPSSTSIPSAALVTDGQFRTFSPSGDHVLAGGVCPVSGLTASLLELCETPNTAGQPNHVDQTVVDARHGGHRAWNLTTTTTSKTKSFKIHSTIRTWFDERTALPVASDVDSRITHRGETQHEHGRIKEKSRFVPASSLPDDFFTPDSVTGWLHAQPGGTPATDARPPQPDVTRLRAGVANDGSRWTLSQAVDNSCYFELAVSSADGSPGGGGGGGGSAPCSATELNPDHLPMDVQWSSGSPAYAVVRAPRGTKTVTVVAPRHTSQQRFVVLNSDPIRARGPGGTVVFVVELPDGVRSAQSARVTG